MSVPLHTITDRMGSTSRSPNFSVQHPLKTQTRPKIPPKLYPFPIFTFSIYSYSISYLSMLSFYLSATKQRTWNFFLSDSWPKTQQTCRTILHHRGCDFHYYHPIQAPTRWGFFLGKTHGVQAMTTFMSKREAESPPAMASLFVQ